MELEGSGGDTGGNYGFVDADVGALDGEDRVSDSGGGKRERESRVEREREKCLKLKTKPHKSFFWFYK